MFNIQSSRLVTILSIAACIYSSLPIGALSYFTMQEAINGQTDRGPRALESDNHDVTDLMTDLHDINERVNKLFKNSEINKMILSKNIKELQSGADRMKKEQIKVKNITDQQRIDISNQNIVIKQMIKTNEILKEKVNQLEINITDMLKAETDRLKIIIDQQKSEIDSLNNVIRDMNATNKLLKEDLNKLEINVRNTINAKINRLENIINKLKGETDNKNNVIRDMNATDKQLEEDMNKLEMKIEDFQEILVRQVQLFNAFNEIVTGEEEQITDDIESTN